MIGHEAPRSDFLLMCVPTGRRLLVDEWVAARAASLGRRPGGKGWRADDQAAGACVRDLRSTTCPGQLHQLQAIGTQDVVAARDEDLPVHDRRRREVTLA